MSGLHAPQFVAVDVGNSRIKLGLFDGATDRFPSPQRNLTLSADWQSEQIRDWLPRDSAGLAWYIASVQRSTAARLSEWIDSQHGAVARLLSHRDLPLTIDVERPESVGMDRLVNAVAANRLRTPGRAAIVIDLGSAITVDLVSSGGAFLGGAILPGISMSAQALHQFTDLLPLVPMSDLSEPPAALGKSTMAALRAGLYWGAVGAMRECVARLSAGHDLPPQVFLTGGAAPTVAALLSPPGAEPAEYVPHLTLGGIALAAQRLS